MRSERAAGEIMTAAKLVQLVALRVQDGITQPVPVNASRALVLAAAALTPRETLLDEKVFAALKARYADAPMHSPRWVNGEPVFVH